MFGRNASGVLTVVMVKKQNKLIAVFHASLAIDNANRHNIVKAFEDLQLLRQCYDEINDQQQDRGVKN